VSLRFSEHGPEFPSELINDLLAGEAVFLCGAGISAPQIPGFQGLVDRAYACLGMQKDSSELNSYNRGSYEEVLGALSRRLANPKDMLSTVSKLLEVPAEPSLEQHRTILRLSRDLSNRVMVVTTNFDTLLERALDQTAIDVSLQSFAGQSLPAPGEADFSGIIHIHGRLADTKLGMDATPLVLTSSEYGDAYMRSGWASRFLFDLARCKTIVLIGYRAADAPVRYFLNVLEADRARFPDLRHVYAFDWYEEEEADAEVGWGTLAVTPLPYCKSNPATGVKDHSPLWDDLRQLAEVIERPKKSREDRASTILSEDSKGITSQQLRELDWLFSGRSDLWPVLLQNVTDPNWFHIFQKNKFWSQADATWLIAAWISQNFEERQRFEAAVEWHKILGHDFLARIDQRLWQNPPSSPFWHKAWRLLVSAKRVGRFGTCDVDQGYYRLKRKLESGFALDAELARAVSILTPSITVGRPYRFTQNLDAETEAQEVAQPRLADIARWGIDVIDEHSASEIVDVLRGLEDHAVRTLELVSGALQASLQTMLDLGLIIDEYDTSDFSVPSIEDHEQNRHHNGLLFLIQAATNSFSKAIGVERGYARQLAAAWSSWPGRLGVRMRLHALRNTEAFSPDEALLFLLEINDHDFWSIRREVAFILLDRAKDVRPEVLADVEARVRGSGTAYFEKFPIEEGQVDWRSHARDAVVWLRLKILEDAGVLSEAGRADLDGIVGRRPYLDRAVEDSDFFGSYSSGVRTVVGDSTPILEAAPDSRLEVAAELNQSPDIDSRLGWSAYCSSDPKGAFESLASAELNSSNIELWGTFLRTLAFRKDGEQDTLRNKVVVEALRRLEFVEPGALRTIAPAIVDVLSFGPRQDIENFESWCDRLLEEICHNDFEINFDQNLYEVAINSPAGRLAEILLSEFDRTRQEAGADEDRQLSRLARAASEGGSPGAVMRAVLVDSFAFVVEAAKPLAEEHLLPFLRADSEEGRGLRTVLVARGNITPEISQFASAVVLRGVTETKPGSANAAAIASCILRPALTAVRDGPPGRWGISEGDVRKALRESTPELRVGALNVLVQWMSQNSSGTEDAWKNMVEPLFERIWPKDRYLLDDSLNIELLRLAVGAGKHFPEALEKFRYYFSRYAGQRSSIFPLKGSSALKEFPEQVLDLLWLLFGPTGDTNDEMADVLDRLLEAQPDIEVDRRFQSLELRTVRYD